MRYEDHVYERNSHKYSTPPVSIPNPEMSSCKRENTLANIQTRLDISRPISSEVGSHVAQNDVYLLWTSSFFSSFTLAFKQNNFIWR